MTEALRYYTLDELKKLSVNDLQALWELVPTDRQRAYRQAYEREIKAAGAEGSDAKERQVARELLKRYAEAALVPIGMRWARAPGRVQEAARKGETVDAPENDAAAQRGKASPKIVLGLGLAALMMVALLFVRGGAGSAGISGDNRTADAAFTRANDFTPTPLALEAQDEVIQGGDAARAAMYPINLQVDMPNRLAPRVWVVQRRAVGASEWNFDRDPDTASFLNGMSVRPIIGIPWSEENAAWFDAIGNGATFNLQMNTGAILRYQFEQKTDVRRSDTGIFRQVSPGLVLLLLGATDDEGLPTASRTMILAAYPPEQELSREGELVGSFALPTPEVTPTMIPSAIPTALPFAGLDVQVVRVTYEQSKLTTRLRMYNGGGEMMSFTPEALWLALGYAENPPGPRVPADGMTPFDLLPGQAADVTLIWLWQGEPFAGLGIGAYQYALQITR
jgi:hypothetical protein